MCTRPGLSEGYQTLKQTCSRLPGSAACVREFDDSLSSAIRTTYRISLRSSSLQEPRHPLLKVVWSHCFCFRCWEKERGGGLVNPHTTHFHTQHLKSSPRANSEAICVTRTQTSPLCRSLTRKALERDAEPEFLPPLQTFVVCCSEFWDLWGKLGCAWRRCVC